MINLKKKQRPVRIKSLYKKLTFLPKEVKVCLHALDSLYENALHSGEISIVFLNDNALAKLHDQFLNDPTKTDVITFQGDALFEFAGEICISVDRAKEMAVALNNSLAKELTLYLVHGFLHLVGYDDIENKDRAKMKKEEKKALEYLTSLKLIPKFEIIDL